MEKLEKERIQRMHGEIVEKTIKHRSADDMDDGYVKNLLHINTKFKNNKINKSINIIDFCWIMKMKVLWPTKMAN